MSENSNIGKFFLNKEIALEDLKKGIEFEMDYDEQYSDSENESYFEDESFKTFKDDVANLDNDYKPKLVSHTNIPFDVLKQRMKSIIDNDVLKEVLKAGTGLIIPEKSVVLIHYDAYLENQVEPFDSTRLRNKPYKFLLDSGGALPGLECAVKTMKKDEMSRFLVSPRYAYQEMGCPPRIPPSAEILFEVELLNFYDCKEAIEFEDLTPEDQKKAPFSKIACVFQNENKMANDLFHSKNYNAAIARYRKITSLLEDVSVTNEEEDNKRNGYLLKLYLNLAQCFLNVEKPNKAIIYSNLALRLDESNAKAFYRMGLAQLKLDEYEKAEHFLSKAKQLKPYDKNINAAIARIEVKRKKHLDWEKLAWGRAFNSTGRTEKFEDLPESNEFVDAVKEQIEAFIQSDNKELKFSPGYTEDQLEVVKLLSKEYNLDFVSKIMYDTEINKVVKKHNAENIL